MKIKTIIKNTDNVEQFDSQINDLLAEGWRLVKREVLPGMNYNADNWARRALYAELVQLDPEPEPEAPPMDPIEALHVIKTTCDAQPIKDCQGGRCPLYVWCCHLESSNDPTEWVLPEKEAPTT